MSQGYHQMPKANFNVRREKNIIYVQTDYSSVGIRHFISIMPKYATVCAQLCFSKTDKEEYKQFTVNIGQISISANRPVPYIAIVDYLREKGYAIQFNGLTVDELINYGWIKLQEV